MTLAAVVAALAATFPALTPHDIGGVRPDGNWTLRATRAHWHVPLPAHVDPSSGSEARATASICERGVRGVAYFIGPTGMRPVDTHLFLQSVAFTAGVVTDRGVRIGSPAKGLRLHILAPGRPHSVLVFEVANGKVVKIGFGMRGSVSAMSFSPHCPRD